MQKHIHYLAHSTLSMLTAIFPGEPVLVGFTEAKGDGGGGDNCSYKTCKVPVKMSPPTNQHPYFTCRMPFLSPNQQCQSSEGENITFHGLAHPKARLRSSNFVFDH